MQQRPPMLADPEDMFNDTRMTIGEHIEDLRSHLIRAGYGLILGVLVSFIFANYVLEFIAKPVEDQLLVYWKTFYERREKEILRAIENDQPIHGQKIVLPQYPLPLIQLAEKLKLPPSITKDINPEEIWILKADPQEYAKAWIAMNLAMRPPALSTLSVQEAFMVS